MFVALTHDYILFFTDHGKVYWLKVYDLPDGDPDLRRPGDRQPAAARRGGEDHRPDPGPRVRRGRVPDDGHPPGDGEEDRADRPSSRPLGRGIIALGLDEGDQLIGVARTKAGDQVVLSTDEGMAIRFDESDVRAMGRPAHGVKGINLEDDDEVVGMVVANGDDDPASLLTVCANGYGKRTALTEYRSQNRGGKGLIDIKTTDRNGPVVADRQGHRRRRGDAHDHRRHPDPHPRRRHAA